ncbi:hypothetical protein [Lentzea sp. NPDC092896]|uniref:hypothetical protein n=1 Tax=Lentzea sp. NPDC092896 TaxID=3364127 RepID=UPI00380A7CA6
MVTLTNAELVAALTGRRRPVAPPEVPGLRFAFYGRMSTSSFQDVQTSRAWQRAVSDELIEGVGSVVVEFSMWVCRGGGRGWTIQRLRRCWPLPRALIVTSTPWWSVSTSGRFTAISSARSRAG